MLTSKQMLNLYAKYGYTISIDYSYNIFLEKPKKENARSSFILGALTGKTNSLKIIVFGLCVCLNESLESNYKFLRFFFGNAQ